MNKITQLGFSLMVLGFAFTGCQKATVAENTDGNFNRSASAYTDGTVLPSLTATIPNVISASTMLTNDRVWFINGPTFVTNGATLTIQPGTYIKGRVTANTPNNYPSFLLVTKGSELIANGEAQNPIVFTSERPACQRTPGDWGGVVILGNGITNIATTAEIEGIDPAYVTTYGSPFLSYPGSIQYGGNSEDDAANASSLKHVRIEFAGDELDPDNELNGLTLGGVGAATTLEHIQVSFGADDSFEFFGGSVNAKWLISYLGNDDDYDFDYGYQGSIQFAVAVKSACTGYSSNPNGIECNNNTNNATVNTRKTQPILTNFTLLGHPSNPGPVNGDGVLFRQGTNFVFVNSVVGGFDDGVTVSGGASGTLSDCLVHGFITQLNGITGTNVLTGSGITNDFLLLDDPFQVGCSCPNTLVPFFTTSQEAPAGSFPSVTHPGGSFPSGSFDVVSFQGAMGTSDWAQPKWVSYNAKGNTY